MKQPVTLICKATKKRKCGKSPIYIQYCQTSDKRTLIDTGEAIPALYWNSTKKEVSNKLPIEFGTFLNINKQLQTAIRKAEDILLTAYEQGIIDKIAFLKNSFSKKAPSYNNATTLNDQFLENFKLFHNSKINTIASGTVRGIMVIYKRLEKYQHHLGKIIQLSEIDYNFFEDLTYFLKFVIEQENKKVAIVGLRQNTIARTIKVVKQFINYCIKKKIIPYTDLSIYKIQEEAVENIYLNEDEIIQLYLFDFTNSHYEKYRDLFVLGCYTGLRFIDYSRLSKLDIKDDMICTIQQKTNAMVVIPLRHFPKKILEKYNFELPKVTNQKFNENIKEICKIVGINEDIKISYKKGNQKIEEVKPKYAWVSSHTCRRSFCTNEYLAGTPVDLIMSVSGHKSERDFKKYIKADQFQKAQLIKEIWGRKDRAKDEL